MQTLVNDGFSLGPARTHSTNTLVVRNTFLDFEREKDPSPGGGRLRARSADAIDELDEADANLYIHWLRSLRAPLTGGAAAPAQPQHSAASEGAASDRSIMQGRVQAAVAEADPAKVAYVLKTARKDYYDNNGCYKERRQGSQGECLVEYLVDLNADKVERRLRSCAWQQAIRDAKVRFEESERRWVGAWSLTSNQPSSDDAHKEYEAACEMVTFASDDLWALTMPLHGFVVDAIVNFRHHYTNYVIRAVLEELPTIGVMFVVHELKFRALWAATHEVGCSLVVRLLPHCRGDSQVREVINEVLFGAMDDSSILCNEFFKPVGLEILETGEPDHKRLMCAAIGKDPVKIAMSKHGSWLVEKCIEEPDLAVASMVARKLLENVDTVASLVGTLGGAFVIKALLHDQFSAGEAQPLLNQLPRKVWNPKAKNLSKVWLDLGLLE